MDNSESGLLELDGGPSDPRFAARAEAAPDRAAITPPAQLAFACYCLAMALVAWWRAGARVVGAMTATERDAWRVSRGLAPLTVAAPVAPTVPTVGAQLRAEERATWARTTTVTEESIAAATWPPATAPAVPAEWSAQATADSVAEGARQARAAWERADLRWVSPESTPAGWVAFESPFTGWTPEAKAGRERLKRAGAQWDKPSNAWRLRSQYRDAVAAVISDIYGRPAVLFADTVSRALTALAPSVRQAIPTVTEPATLAPRVAGIEGLAAASRARRNSPPRGVPAAPSALAALDTAIGADGALTERREAVADVAAVRDALSAGALVAGARVEGQGVLVGWTGRREATRAQLRAALETAECPDAWAPKSKSAKAHLGVAVGKLSREGLIPRVARDVTEQERRRGVSARWIVGTANFEGQAGDALGRIALTVELVNDEPRFDGDVVLAGEVRDEYNRLTAGELYAAADVTAWLSGVLRTELGAVRMAQAFYVRAVHATQAEALCNVMADGCTVDGATWKGWGTDWTLPALPVATSAQLRAGLARGLITEARDVLDTLESQREAAKRAKRADIGTRAAITLLGRLRTVSERAAQYAVILGGEQLAAIRKEIAAALAVVEPLCDDTSQRGAMLELD